VNPGRIDAALLALSLDEIEETGGELHRRVASALRMLGEGRADRAKRGERSARWQVAALAASTELAATTLGATLSGQAQAALPPLDEQAGTIAAMVYAAPSIPALLARLEQDRRLLTSLARALEAQFDDEYVTFRGAMTLRELVTAVTILDPARYALALEAALTDDAESEPGESA
jgi:hypothetical protein